MIPIVGALLAGCAVALPGASAQALSAAEAQARVGRALANELAAVQQFRPMRYQLRKSTPRLSTTREIYETREGGVARLLEIDGQPLSPAAAQQERARLEELETDPGRQRHRKQAEAADTARALTVLRALPLAFLYEYAGAEQGPTGRLERFTFRPNPAFSPPNLETQALTAMAGQIWINPAAMRVVRLDASLQRDVAFGWGILGRLNRGGWIRIEQAEVSDGAWRTVRLQLDMNGRVLFKTRRFQMIETMSDFAPLPAEMTYRQAITELLRKPVETAP